MERAAKNTGAQINNETFFSGQTTRGWSLLKKTVNWLITLESKLFFWIPSPNAHFKLKKL
jgi:hypothetical protein